MLTSVASMVQQFCMPDIELLLKMGYVVDVACNFERGNTCTQESIIRLKERLTELGVTYYDVDIRREVGHLAKHISAFRIIKELMVKTKYAFVHCHSPIGGVIGRLAGHMTKTDVIYTAHGFHFYEGAPGKSWLFYFPVEKILSRLTKVLITINTEDYRLAKQRMKAKNVRYVPGVGIDLPAHDSDLNKSEERTLMRSALGIPMESTWILSVGELNKNKNHETVIRALAEMAEQDIYYTVAGIGSKQKELENLVNELGLAKRVKLLGFRDDVHALYRSADIYIHPSFREGLSVAIMEAMSEGMPCCVSKIRGHFDLVDSAGGVLFNPYDVEDCLLAIERSISMDFATIGVHNKQKIKSFSRAVVGKQMENIYATIHE